MLEHDIWFSFLKISNKNKINLLSEYGSPERLWQNYSCNDFNRLGFVGKFQDNLSDERIKEICNIILNEDIKVVNYADRIYPNKLKQIDNAPPILFYKGDVEKLDKENNISIVGSRKYTNYGMNVTKIISSELAKNNINIISGMARGIDSYAHAAALENGAFTCAVLGCGVDIVYPKSNKKLYDEICEKGCVLSEFIPGTPPLSQNFPIRNRIISGLSDIIIIIEANLKSGTLITANFALEQGKDVLAVPGSIFSEQSKGCNKLIKEGAYPLTNIEDIFEMLEMNYVKNIEVHKCKENPIEKKLYSILSDSPLHIDDIIKITNIDIKQLYEVLFELQLKDEIMCLAGNYYVKNNKTL